MPGLHAFAWEPTKGKPMFPTIWRPISYGLGGLLALALVFGVVQTVRVSHLKKIVATLRIDLDQVKSQRDTERANHQATKDAYRQAQAEAERMEAERLARITAQQKRINDERLASYNSRIAAARAASLRAQARGGVVSAPDCQPVSGLPDAAGRADGCSGALSADERLTAEIQAIRLDALQQWVRDQAAAN